MFFQIKSYDRERKNMEDKKEFLTELKKKKKSFNKS